MNRQVFLYKWWWAIFVVVYPLIFVPSERGFWGSNYAYHVAFTAIFVVGAALFEWFLHPHLRLGDVRHLPRVLWRHKPVLLVLLYGIWGILAAFFTPMPAIALMGSLSRNGDGALVSFLFSLVFVFVYIQVVHDRTTLFRISAGVVASGLLLSIGAILEIALGRGLIYLPPPADLPIVTFPQKGHLAGYLVATLGVALALWFRKPGWTMLAVVFIIAFSVGLTYNRAAFVAIALILLLGLWRMPRLALISAFIVGVGVFSAIQWTQIREVGGQKELTNTGSMQSRLLFWKAAVGGILERPLFGWGGGNFDYYWPFFLSQEEQAQFLKFEAGVHKMIEFVSSPGTIPLWVVENEKGERYPHAIVFWKSHNLFLEITLQKGLIGLGLYGALLVYGLVAFLRFAPGAVGLWIYHIFLMLWFVFFFSEGVMWVLFAASAQEAVQLLDGCDPKPTQ